MKTTIPLVGLAALGCATLLVLGCTGAELLEVDVATEDSSMDFSFTSRDECSSDGDCEDDNACTVSTCGTGGECVHEVQAGLECDDGNGCTAGDACNGDGECVGSEAADCDDGNPCTDDSCDPAAGCVHVDAEAVEDCDGSPCTSGDLCEAGECVAGNPIDCDDGSPDDCAFAMCNPQTGECDVVQTHPEGRPCLDGNPCTDEDQCSDAGECLPGPSHSCVAQHPCKAAWCNEQAKEGTNPCVMEFLPQLTPCDDGSKCTDSDLCLASGDGLSLQCTGTPVNCNDGNPCTLDSCAEETGCSFEPKTDGTPCETGVGESGFCTGGFCLGEGQDCDDGVDCTVDTLSPGGDCVHTPNHALCDDGAACNGVETCDTNQGCIPGQGMVCDDTIGCTVDSCDDSGCLFVPSDLLCNDGNECTNDACDVAQGCLHANNSAACDDGNKCTTGDLCSNGMCGGGATVVCDDSDPCTVDSCDPGTGCVATPGGCGDQCTPYDIVDCYTGPIGTAGIGACKKGHRQCLEMGQGWSPCYGENIPAGEDICGNNLDDDCDGSQADENCSAEPGIAVWVDWDYGSDETGDGSFENPYKTIVKGVGTGKKLIMMKADADGTVYEEIVKLGAVTNDIHIQGWGPVRPVLHGGLDIVHCYDCIFENIEIRYPAPGLFVEQPTAAIDAVHNYRNTFSNIRLTAPDGLPGGKALARCHHGYDNLFIDVEVDDLALLPNEDGSTFPLLHWQDHGSGSQFIRCRLGSNIHLAGAAPENLSILFISVGGYCGNWPQGVSSVRNCVASGLNMSSLATGNTTFEGVKFWCYTPQEDIGGLMVANNTISYITATTVRAIDIDLPSEFDTVVSGNVLGPFFGDSSEGVRTDFATEVTYSDIYQVTTPVASQATLGAGAISEDPKFVNPVGGDFHLQPGSPCVSTGNPAFPDADGTAADMGAYGGPLGQW